jgi:hypothetical protein
MLLQRSTTDQTVHTDVICVMAVVKIYAGQVPGNTSFLRVPLALGLQAHTGNNRGVLKSHFADHEAEE